jgi:hypothetical protein
MWYGLCQGFLEEGRFDTHAVEVRKGGFEGVIRGAEEGRKGMVKGVKLVYRIAEPVMEP